MSENPGQTPAAIPVLLDIIRHCTGAGAAGFARTTPPGWTILAWRGQLGELQAGSRLTAAAIPGDRARQHGTCRFSEDLVAEDLAADPVLPAAPPHGIRSFIAAPVGSVEGGASGLLFALDTLPRPFGAAETVAMFETFAALIGPRSGDFEARAALAEERRVSALGERFIATLGHDLRNPLTAILGGMEMLRRQTLGERAGQWAAMVAASAGRMAGLIDLLSDFSSSRLGGGLLLDCRSCDALEAVLQETLIKAVPAADREIDGRFDLQAPVQCDPRRISQLLASLLGHALKFGAPGQPVRVRAASRPHRFDLTVAYGGEAMPPPVLARIFEPFAEGGTSPGRDDLGLGLFIARQIALAHGGSLEAASSATETCFTLRVPAPPAEPPRR